MIFFCSLKDEKKHMQKNTKGNIDSRYQLKQLINFTQAKIPLLLILNASNNNAHKVNQKLASSKHTNTELLQINGMHINSTYTLLEYITKHINAPMPSPTLRLEEQLKTIIDHAKKHKIYFFCCINNADNLHLSILAALSHISLLQEQRTINIAFLLLGSKQLEANLSCICAYNLPYININKINEQAKLNRIIDGFSKRDYIAAFFTKIKNNCKIFAERFNSSTMQKTVITLGVVAIILAASWAISPYMQTTPVTFVNNKQQHYAVEVFHSNSLKTAHKYIHQHHLGNRAQLNVHPKSHAYHYTVELGNYKKMKTAQRALSKLQPTMRNQQAQIIHYHT
jgi:hypothetical protein